MLCPYTNSSGAARGVSLKQLQRAVAEVARTDHPFAVLDPPPWADSAGGGKMPGSERARRATATPTSHARTSTPVFLKQVCQTLRANSWLAVTRAGGKSEAGAYPPTSSTIPGALPVPPRRVLGEILESHTLFAERATDHTELAASSGQFTGIEGAAAQWCVWGLR